MGHFQYIVCSIFILCLFIKIGIPSPYLIADRGFCNETYTTHLNTKCQHCDINVFTDCPAGFVKQTSKEGVAGCEYMQSLGPGHAENRTGCYHTCLLDKQVIKCCPGYWGPQCQGQCKVKLNSTKCNRNLPPYLFHYKKGLSPSPKVLPICK